MRFAEGDAKEVSFRLDDVLRLSSNKLPSRPQSLN